MKVRTAFMISSAALTLMSCGGIDSFEGLYSRAKGEEIVFGVSSSSDGVVTKSVYSGDEIAQGSKNYERIDWVEGEKLSIACAKVADIKTFNYEVVSVESSGKLSYADITHDQDEEGLHWGDDGDYYFYAQSPSSANLTTYGITSFSIPKDQTGTGSWNSGSTKYTVTPNPDYMHMTSYSVVTKNGSAPAPPVDLPFSMLPTVIEFTLSGETDMAVKNIGLLSSNNKYLTGRSEVDIASQARSTQSPKPEFPECTTTEGFNEAWLSTMTSGGSTVEIDAGKSLTGTLFLNPTDISHLSFCITTKDDGADTYTTRKTPLKYASGGWLQFDAHKKYRIKGVIVPGGVEWTINFDPTVEQWNNPGDTPIKPVPEVEYETFVTSWDSGVEEEIELGQPEEEMYVDLGLSVLWAKQNIGATKPEESGWYFSWGNVDGYVPSEIYDIHYIKWASADNGTELVGGFSGDNYNSTPGVSLTGDIPANGTYDAVCANWNDGGRMPTGTEFLELIDRNNCSWEWMAIGGINGYKVTGKKPGYTDKWIFLPVTGYGYITALYYTNAGYYWSKTKSSMSNDLKTHLHISEDQYTPTVLVDSAGSYGYPVRAVKEK